MWNWCICLLQDWCISFNSETKLAPWSVHTQNTLTSCVMNQWQSKEIKTNAVCLSLWHTLMRSEHVWPLLWCLDCRVSNRILYDLGLLATEPLWFFPVTYGATKTESAHQGVIIIVGCLQDNWSCFQNETPAITASQFGLPYCWDLSWITYLNKSCCFFSTPDQIRCLSVYQ